MKGDQRPCIYNNFKLINMPSKKVINLSLATICLLSVPLIAMQYTNEVNWTSFDFIFAGTLIFGTGLLFELARERAAGNTAYKVATGLALTAAFLLVWVNGAVGLIGNEDNPVNLMYFGVLAVGIVGTIMARLKPPGMARALFAMAIAQMLVPMIALIAAKPQTITEPPGIVGVFILNTFFAMMFAGSALLFRSVRSTSSNNSHKEG